MASTIGDLIANAIRDADRSYFFEDYSKQAAAVLKALERRGYAVVPKEPTPPMLKAARNSLVYGVNKSSDIVTPIYKAMIEAAPPAQD
jgi:predicted CoA-binding protein